eukprot:4693975-Pleurochrysis_carterae.AAC.1
MSGGIATFATNQQGTGTNGRATGDSRSSSGRRFGGTFDRVSVGGAGDVPRMDRVARPATLQHVPHVEWIDSGEQHV